MELIKYIVTGLAGSTALTGLHQSLKDNNNTPRVDLLGKQAVEKMLGDKKDDYSDSTLYNMTLAGDILGNSIFYGIIGRAKNPVSTGLLVGLAYGVSTLLLPEVLGLNKNYVKSTRQKSLMTVGYYTFGGLVAGITARMVRK